EILAVTNCTPRIYAPACIDAINCYYGRPTLRMGTLKGYPVEDDRAKKVFTSFIADEFPNRAKTADAYEDAQTVLRSTLASQPDHSVTMVAIGPMTNLMLLLQSQPDEYSPLDGIAL